MGIFDSFTGVFGGGKNKVKGKRSRKPGSDSNQRLQLYVELDDRFTPQNPHHIHYHAHSENIIAVYAAHHTDAYKLLWKTFRHSDVKNTYTAYNNEVPAGARNSNNIWLFISDQGVGEFHVGKYHSNIPRNLPE